MWSSKNRSSYLLLKFLPVSPHWCVIPNEILRIQTLTSEGFKTPMDFRIADTFTDSLARLTGDEQKAVKTTAFDLQLNPASPGLSFHKLDKAKDRNFWSVRVSRDIRLILHKTLTVSFFVMWVITIKPTIGRNGGSWRPIPKRERRSWWRFGNGPAGLAGGLHSFGATGCSQTTPFANTTDDELLGYGVPPEWLKDVRQANEDSLLALADRLPAEAAEALLELATGGKPRVPEPALPAFNPFDHPDAQRRFRVMTNVEELERALEFPWDKWTIFLHPEQRLWVERSYNGPARVSGSAGTGKTIVALHRAVFLARTNPETRVLLTTFSHTLANAFAPDCAG
jgi:hypothetical protein